MERTTSHTIENPRRLPNPRDSSGRGNTPPARAAIAGWEHGLFEGARTSAPGAGRGRDRFATSENPQPELESGERFAKNRFCREVGDIEISAFLIARSARITFI